MRFFFSSRRRHTILTCDWSSDVCSSDLLQVAIVESGATIDRTELPTVRVHPLHLQRSEERRVGKECRWRGEQEAHTTRGRPASAEGKIGSAECRGGVGWHGAGGVCMTED